MAFTSSATNLDPDDDDRQPCVTLTAATRMVTADGRSDLESLSPSG